MECSDSVFVQQKFCLQFKIDPTLEENGLIAHKRHNCEQV
jgi:hypothetical protein